MRLLAILFMDMLIQPYMLKKLINLKNSWEFTFSFDNLNITNYKKYIVEKGSISINGISLTVANVFEKFF